MQAVSGNTSWFNFTRICILFLVLAPLLVFCKERLRKNNIPGKNPVEYVYSISKDSMCKIISLKLKVNNMMIWDAKHKNMVLNEISNLLEKPNNKSDFCIMPLDYIGKSKVYLQVNGDSINYWAWFYLHLDEIADGRTSVKIRTFESQLIIGRELIPKPPHFIKGDKTISVEPTTIEEYQILLKLGNLVGEEKMPLL